MKTGLVLEGGASRTLFSCGVIDALLEEKINIDYIIGVSAGIAYGVGYASGQIGRNLNLATTYIPDKRYMGFRHMLNPNNRGYYNLDFIFDEIPSKLLPFDFDAFSKFSGQIVAVVTNLKTGKAEYIDVSRNDKAFRILRASCALPVIFQPETIDGKLYMDGGIADSIPYKRALDDGCDKIITVLTREKDYVKGNEFSTFIAKSCYKKYPEFVKQMVERPINYNNCRKELFEYSEKNNSIVIMPHSTKDFGRNERSPQKLTGLYNDGYETTKSMIDEIKNYINS